MYFLELCGHYASVQRWITVATLVVSSGATVTLLGPDWLPKDLLWIRPVLAAAAAGLSAWSLAHSYHARGEQCRDLGDRWQRIATAYEHLWDDMYDDEAESTLRDLQTQEAEASKAGGSFATNQRRIRHCYDTVLKHRSVHLSSDPTKPAAA